MSGAVLLVALTSCKKETAATNVESIKFASSTYSVDEADKSLNLKAQLVAVPNGILDTAKITWSVTPEGLAIVKDNCLIPNEMGSVVITATVQNKTAECKVTIYGSVTDRAGKKYKTVKIGNNIWMAENLDCLVYDTESQAELNQLSYVDDVTKLPTFTPYCVNAKDKSTWTASSESVTDEIAKKFGTLYNWAAAVGLADESKIKGIKEFGSFRQGICPNGWHLPKEYEISSLFELAQGTTVAGKKLKSTSGWNNDGNGTDDFGFSIFPSGVCSLANDVKVFKVGDTACFWASGAPDSDDATYSSCAEFYADSDYARLKLITKKAACSVRCVKTILK